MKQSLLALFTFIICIAFEMEVSANPAFTKAQGAHDPVVLIWDYTENAPSANPDNGLYYGAKVNDPAGTNCGLKGIKLNSSGFAYFEKPAVAGKLTLTIGNRKTADAYTVNVFACTISNGEATKGDLIGEVSVDASPNTGSLDIPAEVAGIYIERKTTAEGVLSKVVFMETVGCSFADATVKQLCVNHWDINGDGELSEAEAAEVDDLGVVFKNNSEITSFNELAYFTGLERIPNEAFADCSSLTSITIPNSVTSIGEWAFSGCSGLTSLTIPNSVTSIYESAFYGCSGLKSVTIPNSVTSIVENAFSECSSLTSVTVENTTPIAINHDCFTNRANATLYVPKGSKAAYEAANYWKEFKKIVEYGSDDSNISFADAIVKQLCVNHWDINGDGELSEAEAAEVDDLGVVFKNNSEITSFNELAYFTGLKRIPNEAFAECSSMTSITIPNSVTSIGENAFCGCGLTSLTIPNSVTSIGEGAFGDCSGLISVTIPNSVTSIGDYAFVGCSCLTSVTIPNSVTFIGGGAFAHCSGLTSVTIGNSVTSIGGGASADGVFKGCDGLTSIMVESGNTVYDSRDNCNAIIMTASNTLIAGCKKTIIPNSVSSIGDYAFDNNRGLTSVTIPNSVTSIGEDAFAGCVGLTSVTIGNSVTSIGGGAFIGCRSLTSVTIPNSVTSIGHSAFFWCTDLKKVEALPENPPSLNDNSFSNYNILLKVPKGCKEAYQSAQGWKKFTNIVDADKYKIVYLVDGEEYKSTEVEYGSAITPEEEPSIEGYTFSGWSGIPETMPAEDVTVTGTFAVNTYKLIYQVDGQTYKEYDVEYGASITAEDALTIEGYTFSGWSEIPESMPAEDVTITGTLAVNTYKLTYTVDGEEYKSSEIEFGSTITPEDEPSKDGYTFSGWNDMPETMPAHDVTITGAFTVNSYKLTYQVDGAEYKAVEVEYGAAITPEGAPTKDGYTFSGWSGIPETMPANDITVTGTFIVNKYVLTYQVDGAEYKAVEVEYGAVITPEAEPTKEGYTFSGWSWIPKKMPDEDVTVTGTFTVNKYKLTYMVDSVAYKTIEVEYGAAITPEGAPTKDGYEFSGWSEIPETMPAKDVTVNGTFTQVEYSVDDITYEITGEGTVTVKGGDEKGAVTIEATVEINGQTYHVTAIGENAFKDNQDITSITIPEGITAIGDNAFSGCIGLVMINIGKDVQSIGNKAFANIGTASSGARRRSDESALVVNCYAESVPLTALDAFENTPIETGKLLVDDKLIEDFKATAPWSGFGNIFGFNDYAAINAVTIDTENAHIYDLHGYRRDNIRKGVNIIRTKDGKTKKMIKK